MCHDTKPSESIACEVACLKKYQPNEWGTCSIPENTPCEDGTRKGTRTRTIGCYYGTRKLHKDECSHLLLHNYSSNGECTVPCSSDVPKDSAPTNAENSNKQNMYIVIVIVVLIFIVLLVLSRG